MYPLIILTIPIVIYSELPFFKLAYQAVVKEKRLNSYVIDVTIVSLLLLGGFFYTEVIAAWVSIYGRRLLLKSENNSKQNLSELFGEQPRSVWKIAEGNVEIEVPVEQLKVGDIVRVIAGQVIAVDGTIVQGFASIDEHKLTGESRTIEKGVGDSVLASTIVLAGSIGIKTEKTGQDTVSMQIAQVLEQTADFKSSLQSQGEKVADRLTLPTLVVSATFLPLFGYSSALAVLTNTFGYKMRLFAPASMLTFLGIASHQGILIKDGRSLDILNQVDTLVFDKTGTLTLEQLNIASIHTVDGFSEAEVLRYAAAAEVGQTHPVAKAFLAWADERTLVLPSIINASYAMGSGIQVKFEQYEVLVGSETFMLLHNLEIPKYFEQTRAEACEQGQSMVYIAFDQGVVGLTVLESTVRPEAQQVINDLKKRGMSLYIISGDQEAPTKKLAETLGIPNYFASTLPARKAELINDLQDDGKMVCFIGDGINDSIALKQANTSVSMSGATSIAVDTAQIVLMDGHLSQLPTLFKLAANFEGNMKHNYLLATVPSIVCIGGIVFFHWGVAMGMALTCSTLFAGIANSTMPLLKTRQREVIEQPHHSALP